MDMKNRLHKKAFSLFILSKERELNSKEQTYLDEHIETCAQCRSYFQTHAHLQRDLRFNDQDISHIRLIKPAPLAEIIRSSDRKKKIRNITNLTLNTLKVGLAIVLLGAFIWLLSDLFPTLIPAIPSMTSSPQPTSNSQLVPPSTPIIVDLPTPTFSSYPPEIHETLPSGLSIDEYALVGAPSTEPLAYTAIQWTQEEMASKYNAERYNTFPDISFFDNMHFSMSADFQGQKLVATEYYIGTEPGESFGAVYVYQANELIDKIPIGNGSPIDGLRGLWTYDQNWVVETAYVISTYHPETNEETAVVTGQITINGVMLNEEDQLDETFGFQTMHGRPFYFYKQDGKINISYDGQSVLLGYDTVPHYQCCSAGILDPQPAKNMVSFFAQKNGTWYYVEIGVTFSPTDNLPLIPPTEAPTAEEPLPQPTIIPETGVGSYYETLLSIPVGENSLQYFGGDPPGSKINGPNAIAVLSDGSFAIADLVGNRIWHYAPGGQVQNIIDLSSMDVRQITDLRASDTELILLEEWGERYRVHRLSYSGELLASYDIPKGFHLEDGLTGIAFDCEGEVLLEIADGSELYRLVDPQGNLEGSIIKTDYLCNGKTYMGINSGPGKTRIFIAGSIRLHTQLTTDFGGLRLLDVLQDGSFYLIREDVVTDPLITVDQTIHYISASGVQQGVAHVPISDYYYPIMRNLAVGPDGKVYALLPQPNSVDIIRLNFY
jgi:hypothetical protein